MNQEPNSILFYKDLWLSNWNQDSQGIRYATLTHYANKHPLHPFQVFGDKIAFGELALQCKCKRSTSVGGAGVVLGRKGFMDTLETNILLSRSYFSNVVPPTTAISPRQNAERKEMVSKMKLIDRVRDYLSP